LGYRTPAEVHYAGEVVATNEGMVECLTTNPVRIPGPYLNTAPFLS